MGFNEVTAAGMSFSEDPEIFGESFTYQNTTLTGVFNQVDIDFQFDEFSIRKTTALVCVTSKPQWDAAGLVPAQRADVIYGGIAYPIYQIASANTAGDPAYSLTLYRAT